MLSVYRIIMLGQYVSLIPRDYEAFRATYPVMGTFHGTPLAHSWRSIEVKVLEEKGQVPGTFIAFTVGMFGCTRHAIDLFGDLLGATGELLPVHTRRGDSFWLYNPLRTLDALDEPRLGYRRASDGSILGISEYAFRPELLRSESLFRVPPSPGSLFVVAGQDDPRLDFKRRVEASGATGLRFDLMWSEDGRRG